MKAMKDKVNNRDKKLLREIVCRHKILKKYKLGKYAQKILAMKVNQTPKRQNKLIVCVFSKLFYNFATGKY